MKFPRWMNVTLLVIALVTESASAEVCTSQFNGSGGQSVFTINPDSIDVSQGISQILATSSVDDWQGESLCRDLSPQTIRLPFYGRLVKISVTGDLQMNGSDASGGFEILGLASVPGHADEFSKSLSFEGDPAIDISFGEMGTMKENNSVCGEEITITLKKIRTFFQTNQNLSARGNARISLDKVRLHFIPTDPNDAKCVNKPGA